MISKCGAELDDLSLLDGKELAAKELVACSCIFFLTFDDRERDRDCRLSNEAGEEDKEEKSGTWDLQKNLERI